MKILGVHFGHDSNAVLIVNGKIIANIAEERLNRIKHSSDPPIQSVKYCLNAGGISSEELDVIALSGKNLNDDFHKVFDNGKKDFIVPVYENRQILSEKTEIKSYDHHLCHASASYYLSGFREKSLILVSDGVGDECSVSIWIGKDGRIKCVEKYPSSGSLGWFYSNVTEALGWIHGDGEGKTMALAPCGNSSVVMDALTSFSPFYEQGNLVKKHDFGEIGKFDLRGSNQWFLKGAQSITLLFSKYDKKDIAAAAQEILEKEHKKLVRYWMEKKRVGNLCLSGGVFLNILLNRRIADLPECNGLFITPDPGDSGLALGAALTALNELSPDELPERLETIYLGPEYTNNEIHDFLVNQKLEFEYLEDKELCFTVAGYIADNKCIGWFQGRMEMGPRALGNRSILMRCSNADNKEYVNNNVKFRESFRPFCPSLLEEDKYRYLSQKEEGKYMILAFESPEHVLAEFPAVAHVDKMIRPQILNKKDNPLYHRLINSLKEQTGEGIVLNTSFNIKGEPIVCKPADAVRCFFSTGMDVLAIGNYILKKNNKIKHAAV